MGGGARAPPARVLRARRTTTTMSDNHETDTIAALATAPGEAGIAIIRLSGPGAFRIADALLVARTPPSAAAPRQVLYGRIRSAPATGAPLLDEVLVLPFRAPHSYTREDVVEIQAHGGRAVATTLLRAVCAAGARLADPGEFTRRAFLNGRLDLLQAEAVADLIHAQTHDAAALAFDQLQGSLSCLYSTIYNDVLCTNADISATIDFAEDELPAVALAELRARLETTRDALQGLINTWPRGHLLREGARVVIAGEPNVGKSTLMNRLLGRERAIVTAVPGTTRDTLEEQLVINGIVLRLVDTAGLRETDCPVEREGVRRAEDMFRSADILLVVLDGSQPLTPASRDWLAAAPPARTLVLLNKSDLGRAIDNTVLPAGMPVLSVSLLQDAEMAHVLAAIGDRLGVHSADTHHAAISERHRLATEAALDAVVEAHALLTLDELDGPLLASQALRAALLDLGRVIGREYSESLLDSIFSRFCIGK